MRLDMLADRVGFSPYHFHRIFREVIGEPAKEYIRRLRMDRAAYRLKVSEETILQIALDAGFKTKLGEGLCEVPCKGRPHGDP